MNGVNLSSVNLCSHDLQNHGMKTNVQFFQVIEKSGLQASFSDHLYCVYCFYLREWRLQMKYFRRQFN